MALDIKKIIQYKLPETNYFREDRTDKSILVVHHTAGGSNPFTVIDGWKARTDKVATSFVIGGKFVANPNHTWKDGEILQAFSSKSSGYHLGLKQVHFTPFELPYKDFTHISIGIEICNFGSIAEHDKKFYSYVGTEIPEAEVVTLDIPYKQHPKTPFFDSIGATNKPALMYHKYTDAQLLSLRDLLIYLCDKYSIPKDYNGDAIFNPNRDALSGKSGIFSHTSYRPDKFDCSPQPSLKRILSTLKMGSI